MLEEGEEKEVQTETRGGLHRLICSYCGEQRAALGCDPLEKEEKVWLENWRSSLTRSGPCNIYSVHLREPFLRARGCACGNESCVIN